MAREAQARIHSNQPPMGPGADVNETSVRWLAAYHSSKVTETYSVPVYGWAHWSSVADGKKRKKQVDEWWGLVRASGRKQHQNFTVWYWWPCKDTQCFGSSSFGLLISPNVWFRDITSPSVSLQLQWKMLPLQCRRHRFRIEHKSWYLDDVLSFSKPWHVVNIISMLFTTSTEHLTTLKVPLSSWMKAPRFGKWCHPGWLGFFKIMFVLQLLTRICV